MLLPVTPTSVFPPSAQEEPPPAAWPPPAAGPFDCDPPPLEPDAPPAADAAPPAPASVACWSAAPMSCAPPAEAPALRPLAWASSREVRRAPHALATSAMTIAAIARRGDGRLRRTRSP